MNEFNEIFNTKVKEIISKQGQKIDDEIKKVLIMYDCKPSQIELRVKPEFYYEIFVKATEFSIKAQFVVKDIED